MYLIAEFLRVGWLLRDLVLRDSSPCILRDAGLVSLTSNLRPTIKTRQMSREALKMNLYIHTDIEGVAGMVHF
ncbi:MAG: hypothetical protein ACOC7J_04115, partial [Armatimonadota bacterium]